MSSELAFVAGFLDAATFVRGGGVFCAHVTGNLIVIASQLIQGRHVDKLTAATLPTFVLAVALVARAYRSLESDGEGIVLARRAVLYFEGAFVALGCLLDTLTRTESTRSWVVLCLVVAMAAQTALQRLTPGVTAATTVMTGNLAQCLVDVTAGIQRLRDAWSTHAARILSSFVIGGILGAATVGRFGFGMLLAPLCVLWLAALRERLEAENPRSSGAHAR